MGSLWNLHLRCSIRDVEIPELISLLDSIQSIVISQNSLDHQVRKGRKSGIFFCQVLLPYYRFDHKCLLYSFQGCLDVLFPLRGPGFVWAAYRRGINTAERGQRVNPHLSLFPPYVFFPLAGCYLVWVFKFYIPLSSWWVRRSSEFVPIHEVREALENVDACHGVVHLARGLR